MIRSDLFDELFVHGLGSDSAHGHLWPSVGLAWHLDRVLPLFLRVHNRVEHTIWLRRPLDAIIDGDRGKFFSHGVPSLNQRFHFLVHFARFGTPDWIVLVV